MDLFEKVSEDIKNAMKAKDKVALETLRNVKKFFQMMLIQRLAQLSERTQAQSF